MRLTMLFLALVFPVQSIAYTPEEVVALLEADPWGWPDGDPVCQDKTRTFTFNSDRALMNNYVSEDDLNVPYKVHSFTENGVRAEIIGDHKYTWTDETVVWEIRFAGPDAFCWHYVGRSILNCSPFLVRCDGQDLGS